MVNEDQKGNKKSYQVENNTTYISQQENKADSFFSL